jgi:hypothetical protein
VNVSFCLAPVCQQGDFYLPSYPGLLERMATRSMASGIDRLYPLSWEKVAHLRVFRTTSGNWDKMVAWRTDMVKRGYRLLRVSSDAEEIVAVFGKTRIGQGA